MLKHQTEICKIVKVSRLLGGYISGCISRQENLSTRNKNMYAFEETFHHFFGETFFDVMDNLSSKYMLPIGGMFTAIFIVYKWWIPAFLEEFGQQFVGEKEDGIIVSVLFITAALVVGFIILNEIIAILTGSALIG